MTEQSPRLTSLAHGGGCGCKLAPSVLQQLLADQPAVCCHSHNFSLEPRRVTTRASGRSTNEPASSPRPTSSCRSWTTRATLDVSRPPMLLSDIYAMGGKPIMALAILGMPSKNCRLRWCGDLARRRIDLRRGEHSHRGRTFDRYAGTYLRTCCDRALPSCKTCGAIRACGRAIPDPDKRDRSGHLFGGVQEGRAYLPAAYDDMIALTTLLNAIGSRTGATRYRSCDDRRHRLWPSRPRSRMARGSGLTLNIDFERIPFLEEALTLAESGYATGASGRNWSSYGDGVVLAQHIRPGSGRCSRIRRHRGDFSWRAHRIAPSVLRRNQGGGLSAGRHHRSDICGRRKRKRHFEIRQGCWRGREWESNPLGTVSLPHPDLKSGRPTGDVSLPISCPGRFRHEIDGPEQIQAVFVDPAQIATPERDAVPIEEIEYLNRDLPAIVHTIAKLRGGEYAAWILCCEFRSDRDHFAHCPAQEKMIMRHFIDTTEA